MRKVEPGRRSADKGLAIHLFWDEPAVLGACLADLSLPAGAPVPS